jgi:hypothetical protein
VIDLVVNDDKLIVGGRFATAGGESANRIAAWDGTFWWNLGAGLDGDVWSLAVYNNMLIAGGDFTKAGGVSANHIAAWDGFSWSPLGPGRVITPFALTVYDDRLISDGGFSADNIAAWDGFSWSSLGPDTRSQIFALGVYDNKLIAGGEFTSQGGVIANSIACWDGSSWSALGSGLNGINPGARAAAFAVYHSKLVVGGVFTLAGAKISPSLAIWSKLTSTSVDDETGGKLPHNYALSQNYPNPFNPSTTIEYSVPKRSLVTIEICNLLGQKVRTLVNETKSAGTYKSVWDGTDDMGKQLSTGVYFYRLRAGDAIESKKMLLLK